MLIAYIYLITCYVPVLAYTICVSSLHVILHCKIIISCYIVFTMNWEIHHSRIFGPYPCMLLSKKAVHAGNGNDTVTYYCNVKKHTFLTHVCIIAQK